MTESRILALDLGTHTGMAFRGVEGEVNEAWDLTAFGSTKGARFDCFARHMTLALDTHRPDMVAVERPFTGKNSGQEAMLILHGLMAFVETICHRRQLPPVRWVEPNHIKTISCGWVQRKMESGEKQFSGAQDVLVAMQARRGEGVVIADANAAIALAIIDLIRSEARGTGAVVAKPKAKRKKAPGAAQRLLPSFGKVGGRRRGGAA